MMDKDKSHHGSGSLIPSSGQSGAFNLPPLGTDNSQFGHVLSRMPDNPPDDMGLRQMEDVLGDMDNFNSNSGNQVGGNSSSLLAAEPVFSSAYPFPIADNMGGALCENPRIIHQHSPSMDGFTTIKPEMHIPDAKFSELTLIDPNCAKRSTEVQASEEAASERAVTESGIIVQTTSEAGHLDDGYKWRKYGHKILKGGNPSGRTYYKCTSPMCNVRKHVERDPSDPKAVITKYEGEHTH